MGLLFEIISPWKRAGSFIWINLNSLLPRMFCAKFGWNWFSGSLNYVNVFSLFPNFLHLERVGSFIRINLNPLHPRKLCAKFGWNWFGGSGEEDENVKSQRRRNIKFDQKSSLELELRWAKNTVPNALFEIQTYFTKQYLSTNLNGNDYWFETYWIHQEYCLVFCYKLSGWYMYSRWTKVFVADVKMAAVCLHCLHNK